MAPCPHYKVEPPSGTKRNERKNEPLWASTLQFCTHALLPRVFQQTLFDYENKQIYLISKTNQRLLENAWEVCTSVGTSVEKHTIKATKPDQVTNITICVGRGLGQ